LFNFAQNIIKHISFPFMAKYSINVLERLSNVKAHTIRIWEKRYNLFEPDRTSTNIRYYNDDELKKLLNITILYENGFKISQIAKFNNTELSKKADEVSKLKHQTNSEITRMLIHMIDFNEGGFITSIDDAVAKIGIDQAFLSTIYPFLQRVGVMWQTGSIKTTHEHFVSNIIRRKLILAAEEIQPQPTKTPFLLFLPEGEWHELGLLFNNYIIRKHLRKVYYLGQSVPLQDMNEIIHKEKKIHLLLTITAVYSGRELIQYLFEVAKQFPENKIFVAGHQIAAIRATLPRNVYKILSPAELIEQLAHLD